MVSMNEFRQHKANTYRLPPPHLPLVLLLLQPAVSPRSPSRSRTGALRRPATTTGVVRLGLRREYPAKRVDPARRSRRRWGSNYKG
uniref:Uncharacterized protein n=1 Tax=Arundo donax TaxID=35708 RepID=A0A0A9CZF5_ARUDO